MMRVCVLATVAIVVSGCAQGAEDEGYAFIDRANPIGAGVSSPPPEDDSPEQPIGDEATLAITDGAYRADLGPWIGIDVPEARISFTNVPGDTTIYLDDGWPTPDNMVIVQLPFDLVEFGSFTTTGNEFVTSCAGLSQGVGWEETSPPLDFTLTEDGDDRFRIDFSASYSDGSTVEGELFGEIR